MIRETEITIHTLDDMAAAMRYVSHQIEDLSQDCDMGIKSPKQAIDELKVIFQSIKKTFREQ